MVSKLPGTPMPINTKQAIEAIRSNSVGYPWKRIGGGGCCEEDVLLEIETNSLTPLESFILQKDRKDRQAKS